MREKKRRTSNRGQKIEIKEEDKGEKEKKEKKEAGKEGKGKSLSYQRKCIVLQ